jgi:hypothetical protein
MSDSRHSLPERLRWAIEQLPRDGKMRGLRHFVRLMEERAAALADEGRPLAGASLTTVQGYVGGKVEPSMAFVAEAADVLGVRAAWLAFGDGPPTGQVGTAPLEYPAGDAMLDAAAERRGLSPATRVLLGEVCRKFVAAAPEPLPHGHDTLFGVTLLELVDLPRELWGLRHDLSMEELNHFAVALLHAIALVTPGPGRGDRLEEYGTVFAATVSLSAKDWKRGLELTEERLRRTEERLERARQVEADLAALAARVNSGELSADEFEARLKPYQDYVDHLRRHSEED